MHYIYLVNRFNLKNDTDEIISRLKTVSEEMGRDYEIIVNETIKDAEKCAQRFRDTEYVITAIGGDGSMNKLINALIGTGNILSLIPAGTGNDFIRTCMQIMDDGVHEVDLIRVNDRYCINVTCYGIDADIANDNVIIHNRWIPRSMRFNAGVIYHFLKYKKGRRLKIEYDGKTEKRNFTTIIAANCQFYGCGYNVSPESLPNDGMMEVFLVRNLQKIKMALLILSMKNAHHLKNPSIKIVKTNKMIVSSDKPFEANIDGEPFPGKRFEMEVVRAGIRFDFNKKFIERVRL